MLTVIERDPGTGEVNRQAAVPVAFDANRTSRFRGFFVGEQFLVVATQQGFTVDEPSASLVFGAELRPAGS